MENELRKYKQKARILEIAFLIIIIFNTIVLIGRC